MLRLENNIFPWMGNRPIGEISAKEVLAAVNRLADRGATESAHRCLQYCNQILRYAVASSRLERNPAADLRGALPSVKATYYASITDPFAIGELLRAIDGYSGNWLCIPPCACLPCYSCVLASYGIWNAQNFQKGRTEYERGHGFAIETSRRAAIEASMRAGYELMNRRLHLHVTMAVLRTFGAVILPPVQIYNVISDGQTFPKNMRTVTVALPGWMPQVGQYEIVQHREFKFTGELLRLNDPELVELHDGVGYITYPVGNLGGDIEVKYWPNAFAEPDIVLAMEKT